MSTGTGSRAAGVIAALAILLLGTMVYQLYGPASDPEVPEPPTPAPTVLEQPTPPPARTQEVEEVEPVADPQREVVAAAGELTAGVTDLPAMGELPPDDEDYDPTVEAQQIFHPFEQTLLELAPLDPESWRAAQEQHALRNERSWRRAEFLRRSGYTEEAGELMLEWARLNGIWQARAYGRPHRPGGEDGE